MNVALRNALRGGGILVVFALIGTALLALTHQRTEPIIARSEQAKKLALIHQVLPSAYYDNDLLAAKRLLPPSALLGTRQPSAVWIARRQGAFAGVVLEAVAPDGYSGDISLLIGITADGTITGVRVTSHRETPGLGDYIERNKSDWIEQFTGKSLASPPERDWAVQKDGGVFDARVSATITARAIVRAVQRALVFHAQHRADWAAPEPPA